ncbi:cytochrome-c peroxidase [Colwellia ponticola]|uniref:C-type cytochrome n=1 Tax=Colwellia ponticola TaxID=2304625 RepID=A0A8H2PKT6_9GAMM|nr:cytochrome c peroxidase [Colwellia ponticola]TMM45722.1 c-type cytochrome [Colwellia ponticola]
MFNALKITAITFSLLLAPLFAHAEPLQDQAKAIFGTLPTMMPGAENDSPAMIALGKKLYMDKRLSVNDSQSCNSCHNVVDAGPGVDNTQFSPGAVAGKFGGRNAPTVWNAGFQLAQFWDGRAVDLKDQAKGPILNPAEMAMPSEQAVVDKISAITEYQQAFEQAFDANNAITYDNLAHAIAAFERTLISKDRFDQYMLGDKTALNEQEKNGLKAFINAGCTACHSGPTLGGTFYQKLGLVKPYTNQADQGRFDVTKNPGDKMFFKVPMLRDVARTAPYYHDGSVKTLTEAVQLMSSLQLGRDLDAQTTADIVAFLTSTNHDRSL